MYNCQVNVSAVTILILIPQGSVLGPILFIILKKDLLDVIKCCMKLYADNAKLFLVANHQHRKVEIQQDVRKVKR